MLNLVELWLETRQFQLIKLMSVWRFKFVEKIERRWSWSTGLKICFGIALLGGSDQPSLFLGRFKSPCCRFFCCRLIDGRVVFFSQIPRSSFDCHITVFVLSTLSFDTATYRLWVEKHVRDYPYQTLTPILIHQFHLICVISIPRSLIPSLGGGGGGLSRTGSVEAWRLGTEVDAAALRS
jgi:hypothetical protein